MENKIRELIEKLNEATEAYDLGKPFISDYAFDEMYFELERLERETGIYLPDSPTQKISYSVVSKLEKVEHNHPMLSLAKTKDVAEVKSFAGGRECVVALKMDGLTCSLTYENGVLVRAETRGNGTKGENILHNARVVKNVPSRLPAHRSATIDGEIIITYQDFELFSGEYKHPRNLASGSIRLLDSQECAKRNLSFVAWDIISANNGDADLSMREKLDTLRNKYGFDTVPYRMWGDGDVVAELRQKASELGYPIDGLVIKYNDTQYYRSLGQNEHHPRGGLALKFYDEVEETTLLDIEWGLGRTGQLTPVAIFNTVELDGTEVNRASLHNLSVLNATLHGHGWVGQKLGVMKANQIIPCVSWAEDDDEHADSFIPIPTHCPVCGTPLVVKRESTSEVLVCPSADCPGQFLNVLEHFCSKKGLDIKGLSKETLTKLIDWGWISEIADLYTLHEHRAEWVRKPGFGARSVDNILEAIVASKHPTLQSFLTAIGIPLIGNRMTKELIKSIPSYEGFRDKVNNKYDFSLLDGFAESKTSAILDFDYTQADKVYECVKPLEIPEVEETIVSLEGVSVVITGKLETFKNRAELQSVIEARGGKVASSVSKNTSVLVNNDSTSKSAKNLSAQKLGIPIMTEKEFLEKYLLF